MMEHASSLHSQQLGLSVALGPSHCSQHGHRETIQGQVWFYQVYILFIKVIMVF